MGRRKLEIGKNTLKRLYLKKNLSPYKIGPILNCSFSTITNRLNEFGVPLKSQSLARIKYPRKDFDGSLAIKSYMIGFRIGDLNVYKVSKNSETIIVRCHTTQQNQVKILKSLFNKFGKITVSKNPHGSLQINCFLNKSFNFLLSKDEHAWQWIKNNKKLSAAFIAGYTDAEGNFILNQKKARFKIDSYDYEILKWISKWLSKNNIANKFKCIYKKGELSYFNGKTWNHDLWRLNINEAKVLEKFIYMILPFLIHGKRIKDAKICLKNIETRREYGTVR